jgi:hypothetical protein
MKQLKFLFHLQKKIEDILQWITIEVIHHSQKKGYIQFDKKLRSTSIIPKFWDEIRVHTNHVPRLPRTALIAIIPLWWCFLTNNNNTLGYRLWQITNNFATLITSHADLTTSKTVFCICVLAWTINCSDWQGLDYSQSRSLDSLS